MFSSVFWGVLGFVCWVVLRGFGFWGTFRYLGVLGGFSGTVDPGWVCGGIGVLWFGVLGLYLGCASVLEF